MVRFDPFSAAPLVVTQQVTPDVIDTALSAVRDWLVAHRAESELGDPTKDEADKLAIIIQACNEVFPNVPVLKSCSTGEREAVVQAIIEDVLGYGPVTPLLADPTVTEIIVRGTRPVMIATNGLVRDTEIRFRSDTQLTLLCQRIANEAGRAVNFAEPICSAWLSDGSRAQIVLPPIAQQGPCLTIRKHDTTHRRLNDLVANETMPAEVAEFLRQCVIARANVVVAGATDTGKTTLLRSLAQCIPPEEYVITIEDIDELALDKSLPHVTALVTRPGDVSNVSHQDLLQSALRMRPTRIIVGEVRGAEALDFLQAASTGHDGSLCSLHAGSPEEALFSRLPLMCALAGRLPADTIQTQIALATELIVQMKHLADGRKQLAGIYEVLLDFHHPEKPDVAPLYVHGSELSAPTGRVAQRLEKAGLK